MQTLPHPNLGFAILYYTLHYDYLKVRDYLFHTGKENNDTFYC